MLHPLLPGSWQTGTAFWGARPRAWDQGPNGALDKILASLVGVVQSQTEANPGAVRAHRKYLCQAEGYLLAFQARGVRKGL